MKKCIIFGNCQASTVKQYLSELSCFSEKYEIYTYANWQLIQNKEAVPTHHLEDADLIIYQPLRDIHGCYSTNKQNPESFFNLLNERCKTISFPRLHNNSLWPIFHKHNNKRELYGTIKNKVGSMDELLYLYNNNLIDYDFDTRQCSNYSLSKEREADTDIKIIDYIYGNLHKHKLFLTHDHPTSRVFNEVAKQVCEHLDIEYDHKKGMTYDENYVNLQDSVYGHSTKQYPLSRYAIKHFGFEFISEEDSNADSFYKDRTIDFYISNK